MKKLLCLFLCLQISFLAPALAQEEGEGEGDVDFFKKTQNDIILIAGAGVGGAILGLSTLSFVDKPSEHVGNIWTGAAVGIIAGVIFVAYDSATKSSEDLQSSKQFSTHERLAWHQGNAQILTPEKVQFGTQFWQMNF